MALGGKQRRRGANATGMLGKLAAYAPLPYVCLAAAIIAGLGVAAYLYAGPLPVYEDSGYVWLAHRIITGTFSFATGVYDYGFLPEYAIALSFLLFGHVPFSAVIPSIVEYVITTIIVFYTCKRLWGAWFGVLAAFMYASAPFAVVNVSRALPDMLTGMITAAFFYLFLSIKDAKRPYVIAAAAGAAAVLPVYAKTEAYIFVGVFLLSLVPASRWKLLVSLRKTHGKSILICLAMGAAACLAANWAIFYFSTGNPLYPIETYSSFLVQCNCATVPIGMLQSNVSAFLTVLSPYAGFGANPYVYPIGILAYLAAIGTLIGIKRGDSVINYLSFFCWAIFIYFFFGTASLSQYALTEVNTRFLTIIAMPLAVLSAYAIVAGGAWANRMGRSRAYGYATVVCAAAVLVASYLPTYQMFYFHDSWIRETIYIDQSALSSVLSGGSHNYTIYTGGWDRQDNAGFLATIWNGSGTLLSMPTGYTKCSTPGNYTYLLDMDFVYDNIPDNASVWTMYPNCTYTYERTIYENPDYNMVGILYKVAANSSVVR